MLYITLMALFTVFVFAKADLSAIPRNFAPREQFPVYGISLLFVVLFTVNCHPSICSVYCLQIFNVCSVSTSSVSTVHTKPSHSAYEMC